jgi:magnesium-protoporphyrin O-methyltransferase
VLDFAREATEVPPADIVVLHRVVCCYPDAPALIGAATTHADRILALTFPADRWYWRLAVRLGNAFLAMRGNGFRGFVHPPALIDRIARNGGLRTIHERIGIIWQTAVYERRGETGD